MPSKNLDMIFNPENIAIFGASNRDNSPGSILMENLSKREKGKVFPISDNEETILGIDSYSSSAEISEDIDLGIIATHRDEIFQAIEDFKSTYPSGLLIITSGFQQKSDLRKKLLEKIELLKAEREINVLGPNSLGVINPSADLNASLFPQMPDKGELTFISQSRGIASSTLDWAVSRQFGFSAFVSVGNMLDIDFADLIDYFGQDYHTSSILMFLKEIQNSEEFMSAARSFARTKPIMAVKSGRHEEGAEAVASHTGSLAGSDDVYNAAFKRAGITRVDTIEDLFTCSETLAKQNLPDGPNLAIVTNAGGPGAMAADSLIDFGGTMASFSDSTIEELEEELPSYASSDNPVDVTGDSSPETYRKSVKICSEDENVDGVLCIYAPLGTLTPSKAAEAIMDLRNKTKKPILPCWIGGNKVEKSREELRQNGYSVQSTPEQSVKAYTYLNKHARNLERLLETPEELPVDRTPPKYHLKAMLRRISKDGRDVLTEEESKKVLSTYGISSPEIHVATSANEATMYARKIGFPVILKPHSYETAKEWNSESFIKKSNSKDEVKENFKNITRDFEETYSDIEIDGVTVQKHVNSDLDLFLGSDKHPVFKSSILFGLGGKKLNYYEDLSVDFPPLNQTLARRLIEDTKAFDYLKDRWREESDVLRNLEENLLRLSQLIIDFPQIEQVEINPLVHIGEKFEATNARIKIDKDEFSEKDLQNQHLVIEPYPRKYVERWRLEDGRPVDLRPIRPEDEPLEFGLFETFSKETWRYRFFGPMKDVSHEDMVRYTNIDYRREMAIVGILEEDGEEKMVGVGRLIVDPDMNTGEFAIVVGDPWQGLGLGEKLTDAIIGFAVDKGLESIWGTILKKNKAMINLCKKLGFEIEKESDETVKATLELR